MIKDVNPEMSDLQVIKLAMEEKRIIISNDKDFLSLAIQYNKVDMIFFYRTGVWSKNCSIKENIT